MKISSEDSEKGFPLSEALLSFARHRRIEPDRLAGLPRASEAFREICAGYEERCAGRQVRDEKEMRDQLERDLLRCLEDITAWRTRDRRAEPRKIG